METGIRKPRCFRAVHSLAEMWAEERIRARRMGLDSQLDVPLVATPENHIEVNENGPLKFDCVPICLNFPPTLLDDIIVNFYPPCCTFGS